MRWWWKVFITVIFSFVCFMHEKNTTHTHTTIDDDGMMMMKVRRGFGLLLFVALFSVVSLLLWFTRLFKFTLLTIHSLCALTSLETQFSLSHKIFSVVIVSLVLLMFVQQQSTDNSLLMMTIIIPQRCVACLWCECVTDERIDDDAITNGYYYVDDDGNDWRWPPSPYVAADCMCLMHCCRLGW